MGGKLGDNIKELPIHIVTNDNNVGIDAQSTSFDEVASDKE